MRVATAEDAARLLAPWFDSADVERVAVVHLDSGGRPIAITLEAVGTVEDVDLPVRAIVASALKAGAATVVVAHNHPSGDPRPSGADVAHSRRLAEALASMDVGLLDHLVFAGTQIVSFRALGLI
ncbi:MAG: JAB domain-containing protein [Allosphingosinicella sp.]